MSSEQTGNSSLVAVLSILAILTISLVAGVLLMQKDEDIEFEPSATVSSNAEEEPTDEFDPIGWVRENSEYPPLVKDEDENFVTDHTETRSVTSGEAPEYAAVSETRRDELAVAVVEKPAYHKEIAKSTVKEVRENMYWIQVVATGAIINAERVRDDLAAMGFPVRVFTKNEGSNLTYRVRVGPFTHSNEAENSVSIIHGIDGFDDSYVTIAPVTRYIEN